jgi:Zn-dependent protease
MLLTEPPSSQGDLHFRLFGFPVRVHPLFWVVTVIMGLQGGGEEGTPPAQLLIWIAIVFISILVHELGHAFLQRRFGGRPWITLHGFGGLASCDDCDSSPRSQILIALAGPVAGFCLAAVVIAALRLSGHAVTLTSASNRLLGMIPMPLPGATLYFEPLASQAGTIFVFNMLWVNIVWGLVNLLPVYPLDGGRISRELCTLNHPRRGVILSLQISIGVAIAMAIFGVWAWQSLFVALMFGYFAFINYQTLQAYQQNRW